MVTVNGRDYRWPVRPVVVVCLDGSSCEYIEAAIGAGVAPFLSSLVERGRMHLATAAMPTFTNPNNVSIVTGVPPSVHGISANFFLDRAARQPVMMNDASFLRAPTILAAFADAGARVAAVTAKDKLRALLGAGLKGVCCSAEQEGLPVYSPRLSEHVLRRGVEMMWAERPDLLYLSTSDFVQHAHPPGSPQANSFYNAIDNGLAALDQLDVTLVVTADHGMNAKTDAGGRPRVIFLQQLCDEWIGRDVARTILPITDPYVAHHGSLGSFATIYVADDGDRATIASWLMQMDGLDAVFDAAAGCVRFELPPDRVGDLLVFAGRDHVLGMRAEDHDLSALRGPLRSHGGLAEQTVPLLCNRCLRLDKTVPLRNFDAFWMALNGEAVE
jgi:phosphonoacetate hydrolase